MSTERIEIDLSESDREWFINQYVMEHMSEESWEVFMDTCHELNGDKYYEQALANAAVNEMVNKILKEAVDAAEKEFYFWPT